MLSLSLPETPACTEDLSEALRAALAPLVSGMPTIEAEGEWPALRRLAIDLSGTSISSSPARPVISEEEAPMFSVERLELMGAPIAYETAQANLSFSASNAQFSLGGGGHALGIAAVESGCFALSMARTEMEKLILAVARHAGEAQGVEIERVKLEVSAAGPGAVSFRARIIANKLFMSAAISVNGRLCVDNALVAHLADLSCSGSGLIGTLACGFLKPRLDRINNHAFPLAGFALGGTHVTELQIDPGEPLRVTASFGHDGILTAD